MRLTSYFLVDIEISEVRYQAILMDNQLNQQALAERLTIARKQAGLNQSQVAKLIGLHRPSISEIEAGRRRVSADELVKFAEIYGVNTKWLLRTGEHDENKDKVELAARELAKLDNKDLDTVLDLLAALRRQ